MEPASQARYANTAVTSYLIASQSLFSLSGLMVLFSCLSAKGLGGDREALTIMSDECKICVKIIPDLWQNYVMTMPQT